ncbi:uncharacterized protein VTP21DRAFT_5443 [Calcarisporiella thermophila]|uniref:uncharacterized protein n=1 Tax=Calcarisporiella thermophila TaxID=911321 RepID=UPI0037449D3F
MHLPLPKIASHSSKYGMGLMDSHQAYVAAYPWEQQRLGRLYQPALEDNSLVLEFCHQTKKTRKAGFEFQTENIIC